MIAKIQVRLFGATGERTTEITARGGFTTRHVKAPRETVPSIFEPVNPKSDAFPAPTLLEVIRWMEASEDFQGWLIIDEILFVATAQYKMKFNQPSLLNALRGLYQQGHLAHRLNRFNQHTFRLVEVYK